MLSKVFPAGYPEESIDSKTIRVASSELPLKLGKPLQLDRFLAYTRNGPWLKPFTGPEFKDDRDVVALLGQRTDGWHVWIAAEYRIGEVETIIHLTGDGIEVTSTTSRASILVHFSEHFEGIPKAHHFSRVHWLNEFGYCTWNSLGTGVTEEKTLAAVDELHDTDIFPSLVIVDDGWQSVDDNRHLKSIYPDPSKFPNGFRGVVEGLKSKGVDKVIIWSAGAGYWNGFIEPLGFDTVKTTRGGLDVIIPSPEGVGRYYETFFSYLHKQGIYGVKIDNMNFLDEIDDLDLRRKIQLSYIPTIYRTARRYHLQLIWCMSMEPYLLSQFGEDIRPNAVLRNSDDFFPEIIDSHFWHVYCNFYNAQYTHQFGLSLDFDMFQTKLKADDKFAARMPSLHAVARSLAGGPVLITDFSKEHDASVVKALVAGDTVPQFHQPPGIGDPYHKFDANHYMVGWNRNENGELLGYFNITKENQTPEIKGRPGHIVRLFRKGTIVDSVENHEDWEAINSTSVTLESGEWELATIVPLHKLGGIPVAVVGLIDKYAGIAAIRHVEVHRHRITLTSLPGKLAFYIGDDADVTIEVDRKEVTFKQEGDLAVVEIKKESRVYFSLK